MSFHLLTPSHANSKINKGNNLELPYHAAILHFAPHDLSGFNVCPKSSPGCRSTCLGHSAGRMRFDMVRKAQVRRTKLYINDRKEFYKLLRKDIDKLVMQAGKKNLKPCLRLNGTSDIDYIVPSSIIEEYPDVQFYDYTARINMCRKLKKLQKQGRFLNYDLTFSAKEDNHADYCNALLTGFNVAIVFRKLIPDFYQGFAVIAGDEHDFRFLDPKKSTGLIIGLTAKGSARHDETGFVRDFEVEEVRNVYTNQRQPMELSL